MPRAEKVEKVREIRDRLTSSQAALFADFRGLTVHDATELRDALADAQASFSVVKNTLTRLAVRDAGLADLEAFLEGPTAIAFIEGDMVAGTKSLLDAAKKFPVLEVKGGVAEGRVLSAEQVKALGSLPGREQLLAQIAGLGKLQMSMALGAFQAAMSKFLRLLEAYKEKVPDAGDGAGAAEAAPQEEPPAAEPEAPAAETEAPAAETEAPAAEAPIEPEASAAETEPEAPAAEAEPEGPAADAEPEAPAADAEPQEPAAEAATEPEATTADAEAATEPEEPAAEAGTETNTEASDETQGGA